MDNVAAVVFPGMGPMPFSDVGRFMLRDPIAGELVAEADDVLGYPLLDRYSKTEGDYSEYAQVAFLINCLALARWAEERFELAPVACAGPSFGGKTAAAYAGCLPFRDAVLMTAGLARLMEEYFATEHADLVTHSFARAPRERLEELLAELDGRGDWHDLACHVDDDFFMVSLRADVLEWFEGRLRAMGALPLYTMRPPMHSALFAPLRARAEEEVIGPLEFADPTLPVVSDHDGSLIATGAGVRSLLLDGFVRAMRWPGVVDALQELGVTQVCVAGPDGLFGRVRRTTRNFEVLAATPKLAMRPAAAKATV
ncbi:ACP S-malonyltransferase [Spongiactinospora gelatinilytica]|uniref:[acyl-carrier-protein] S-malonyltransferase n=1 Tax=Spongiactinospora gelatinilytica TaxID=2666298 RepID=A0A2W2HND3_9ACTN|nr:ACP S-malonyltransferase [Spongiactinospora gelatinilytica]PZG51950.1 ACP S-malonyltransferase [Spongiactinospora gelatinilytica]